MSLSTSAGSKWWWAPETARYDKWVAKGQCPTCGLVIAVPRPHGSVMVTHYEDGSHSIHIGAYNPSKKPGVSEYE